MIDSITPPMLALTSAFLGGLSSVALRYSTAEVSPILANFLRSLVGALGLLALVISYGALQASAFTILHLAIMAYIAFSGPLLAWYLYIKALSLGDVSLVHPISNTYPIVAMIAAYLLIKANIYIPDLVGGTLVIMGMRLITETRESGDGGGWKPVLLAFAVALLWGLNTVLFKVLLAEHSPLTLAFLRSSLSFVMMLPVVAVKERESCHSARHLLAAMSAGLTADVAGITTWLSSLQMGEVSTAAVLSSTSPVFSALISQHLLGEKPPSRRWIGILLTVAGVALVSLG